MRVIYFLKRKVKSIIAKTKVIIKEKIPIFFQKNFEEKRLIKILNTMNISNVKRYKAHTWHFKYRYYTGIYQNNKVFIKISTRKKWIEHEYEINKYIEEKSRLLTEIKAHIYLYKDIKKYGILVEEFIESKPLKKLKPEKKELKEIIKQLIEILKELQKIELIYMDFHEDNIYVDNNTNIRIIDLGFAIQKDKSINYIGTQHLKDLIFTNINGENRLGVGIIDDVVSVITLLKRIDPEFIIDFKKEYNELNNISNVLIFNYEEYKNEN